MKVQEEYMETYRFIVWFNFTGKDYGRRDFTDCVLAHWNTASAGAARARFSFS